MKKKHTLVQKIKGNGNITVCSSEPIRESCIDCVARQLKHQERIIELLIQKHNTT